MLNLDYWLLELLLNLMGWLDLLLNNLELRLLLRYVLLLYDLSLLNVLL